MKKLYAYKRLVGLTGLQFDRISERNKYTSVQATQVMYLTDVNLHVLIDSDAHWERDPDFDIQIPQDVHSTKDT